MTKEMMLLCKELYESVYSTSAEVLNLRKAILVGTASASDAWRMLAS